MFKKILFAAAVAVACSPVASAQDFFYSFDENSRVTSNTVQDTDATGSIFIFSDENFDFNQLDLNFTNDNTAAASVTGGVVFNPGSPDSGTAAATNGGAFTAFNLDRVSGAGGRLFGVSFLTPGQVPGSGAANFRAGANGFLLAEVDFDIAGQGTTNFEFSLDDLGGFTNNGVANDGVGPVVPTFGSATLTVAAVPEPSSAMLLVLGAAGMVARRRRS